MEIVGVVCAIVGVLYLIYQFNYLPGQNLKIAKQNLILQYLTSQKLIDSHILEIDSYARENNCYDVHFGQGATFGSYLQYLKSMRRDELSDDLERRVEELELTSDVIKTMSDSLTRQIHSFNTSIAYFQTTFKYN